MPILHLLRHAKSSWDAPGLDDHERSLAGRGRKAAPAMGKWMAAAGVAPELILVSTARRCRETLAAVLPELPGGPTIEIEAGLYLASADDLLARLRRIPAEPREVMVIGHNPGLHELALLLCRSGPEADLQHLRQKFPTGSLASLSSDSGWSSLRAASMALIRFARPDEILDA